MNEEQARVAQIHGAEAKQLLTNKTFKLAMDSIEDDARSRLTNTPTTMTSEIKDAVRVMQLVVGIKGAIQNIIDDGSMATQYLNAIYETPEKKVINRGH